MTKLLAFMVQSNLEEHKKANPEFAVQVSLSVDLLKYSIELL